MPEMGASKVPSRRLILVVSSEAWAALRLALAVSIAARELSSAMPEMNCCAARRSLLAWLRSACTRLARIDSRLALRSATRLARSASSMRPSTWPACTRLPSATVSASSVPPALARTMAVCGATSGPENSTTPGRRASVGCTTSRLTNSSGTSGFLSPFSDLPDAAWLAPLSAAPAGLNAPRPTAKPAPAKTATATPPPSHHCFFMPDSPPCMQHGRCNKMKFHCRHAKQPAWCDEAQRAGDELQRRGMGAQAVSTGDASTLSARRAKAQRSRSATSSGRLNK